MKCVDCGHELRPRGARVADYPGTILLHSKGRCAHCYRRHRKGLQPCTPTRYKPFEGGECVDCRRPVRPNGSRVADFPGLVKVAAGGRCGHCHGRFLQGLEPSAPWRTPIRNAPKPEPEPVATNPLFQRRDTLPPLAKVIHATTKHVLPCGHVIITYRSNESAYLTKMRRQHRACPVRRAAA